MKSVRGLQGLESSDRVLRNVFRAECLTGSGFPLFTSLKFAPP